MSIDDVIRQMREREEMMRRLAEGPLADVRKHQLMLDRANEAARSLELIEKNSAVAMSRLASVEFVRTIEQATRHAGEVMARLNSPQMLEAIEQANSTQRRFAEFAQQSIVARESLARQMGTMALQIEATLRTVSTIDFSRIATFVSQVESHRARLGITTERLVVTHTQYLEALSEPQSPLHQLPESLQQLPTQDLFIHTGTVRDVSPHEPAEPQAEVKNAAMRVELSQSTTVFLEATLPLLHPPFLSQYHGAKARSTDQGPDAWTQGGASLRKLLKGVLHRAAPNEIVLPWAKARKMELDRLGRPTRATKVAWLCEPVKDDRYRDYMHTEMQAALAVINLLDASQHEDEFEEFQHHFETILLRVEIALRHILELRKLRD